MIRIEPEPIVWALEHASNEAIAKWPFSLADKKKSFYENDGSSSAEGSCRCLDAFNGLRPDFLYGPRLCPVTVKGNSVTHPLMAAVSRTVLFRVTSIEKVRAI